MNQVFVRLLEIIVEPFFRSDDSMKTDAEVHDTSFNDRVVCGEKVGCVSRQAVFLNLVERFAALVEPVQQLVDDLQAEVHNNRKSGGEARLVRAEIGSQRLKTVEEYGV